MNYKTQITKIILLSYALSLSACSSYKLDIQQGNLITQKSISTLKKGMTKRQVQALLGTPLMQDNFHNNRWDYVFYQNKQGDKNNKPQNITLIFQNEQLVNVSH